MMPGNITSYSPMKKRKRSDYTLLSAPTQASSSNAPQDVSTNSGKGRQALSWNRSENGDLISSAEEALQPKRRKLNTGLFTTTTIVGEDVERKPTATGPQRSGEPQSYINDATSYTPTPRTPIQCRNCGILCSNDRILETHMQHAHYPTTAMCPVCGELFTHKTHLIKHTKELHPASDIAFRCHICGRHQVCIRFRNLRDYENHLERAHANDLGRHRYRCIHPECHLTFAVQGEMMEHRITAHPLL